MIDMSELMVDPDFVQWGPVQITRTQGAYDGGGAWHDVGPKTIEWVTMIVQQSTPAQLMALPEGERDGDFITCWSASRLIVADGVSQQASDVISWRSKPYRVVRCADRSDNGFWEAIAQWSPDSGGTNGS
jgi:hypothetical protein